MDMSDNMACKQQQQETVIDKRYVHVDTPSGPRGEKREANSPLTPLLSDTDNSSSLSMIKSTQIEKQTRISDFFADNQAIHHQALIQGHHAITTPITQTFAPTSSSHKTDTNAFHPSSTSTPVAPIFKSTNSQQHSTVFDKPTTTNSEMVATVSLLHTSKVTSAVSPSHQSIDLKHGMDASLKSYLDNMTEIINKNIVESSQSLREIINGQTEELEHLRASNTILVARTTIDEGRITRLEKNVTELKENLLRLTQQTMKDNVILQGVPEDTNESVFHTVKTFMTEKLRISPDEMEEVYVMKAHRMGSKNERYPRQIITKVNDRSKSIIFQHTRNLKGTKYSVFTQMPRELDERRKHLVPIYKDARKKNLAARWYGDKLKVGNTMMEVTPDKVMDINSDTVGLAVEMKVKRAPPKVEGGSTFQGNRVEVTCQDDIIPALHALYSDQRTARATHNIYAYRLKVAGGMLIEHFEDDGEHGAGRRLLSLLQRKDITNTLVCVTRWSGKHLGPARFNHILDSANAVLDF